MELVMGCSLALHSNCTLHPCETQSCPEWASHQTLMCISSECTCVVPVAGKWWLHVDRPLESSVFVCVRPLHGIVDILGRPGHPRSCRWWGGGGSCRGRCHPLCPLYTLVAGPAASHCCLTLMPGSQRRNKIICVFLHCSSKTSWCTKRLA